MSKNKKLSEALLSIITKSSRFLAKTLGNMMDNLGKKDVLHKLATIATSSHLKKLGKKRSGKDVIKAGKGST